MGKGKREVGYEFIYKNPMNLVDIHWHIMVLLLKIFIVLQVDIEMLSNYYIRFY